MHVASAQDAVTLSLESLSPASRFYFVATKSTAMTGDVDITLPSCSAGRLITVVAELKEAGSFTIVFSTESSDTVLPAVPSIQAGSVSTTVVNFVGKDATTWVVY